MSTSSQVRSPNPRLCPYCQRIDFNYGSLHYTLEGLRSSARGGCPCCQMIAETLIDENQVGYERSREGVKRLSTSTKSKLSKDSSSSSNQAQPSKHVTRESSISVDIRRNLLFYTVYDCKGPGEGYQPLKNVLRRFEICKARGNSTLDLDPVTPRLLENTHSSIKIFDLISSWISSCTHNHETCRHDSAALPTRVLDVSRDVPILVTGNGKIAKYVLLSHCWGAKPTLRTTKDSLVDMQLGIPMKNLPKTFYDAVVITKKLGVQYLWIDSLCIVQDLTEDWTSEAAKMQEYYKNGYLTISALFSSDSHSGILNPRQISQALLVPEQGLYLRPQLPEQSNVLRTAPLSTRAWVLQERILSTRVLHYGEKEVFWECLTCSAREGSTVQSTEKSDPDSVVTSESADFKRLLTNLDQDMYSLTAGAFATWCRLVMQYSRRALTYQSDKLPAISGLATVIQKETGATYVAGLWKEDIRSLLWMADESGVLGDEPFKDLGKPSPYFTPSWSWISASRFVKYNFDEHVPSGYDAQIISYNAIDRTSVNRSEDLRDRLVLRASARDILHDVEGYRYFHEGVTGPNFSKTLLCRRVQDLYDDYGYVKQDNNIGQGFLDERGKLNERSSEMPNARKTSIVECKALWVMRLLSEAKLEDQISGRVGRSAALFCLLVVPTDTESELMTWRRIGVGVIYGREVKLEDWSELEEFILV